jgi:predicted ribosome quality control (RQC) complex YloA/Tae2 family protein
MPRVHHVKKARKDNPAVKAGESYYWWKFRFGGKRYSKTRPRRSQLTGSAFLSELWEIEDTLDDVFKDLVSQEEIEEARDEIVSQLENMLEECQSSLDNMPYELQDTSDSGMLLQERIDGLEGWIGDIQGIDCEGVEGSDVAEEISGYNPGVG